MIDFHRLKVWAKAHELTLEIYRASSRFPKEETYGLTNQMRRAALSIPSNLAEGCGRNTQAELAQFSQVAMGSASELEYQLLLAHDLHYLDESLYQDLSAKLTEVKRMLNHFILRIRSNSKATNLPDLHQQSS